MTDPEPAAVAANLAAVRARIAAAAQPAGRDAADITLVAVAKTHGPDAVRAAYAAGQRCVGENRVHEAAGKYPSLRAELPDLRLHLIGPLQTNKVKDALRLFDVIETVDRERLVNAIADAMKGGALPPEVMVQVNTGKEPQKAGVLPEAADALIARCRALGLDLRGLMCIPPVDEPPALHFALLREIAKRNGLGQLSMGMSADFETAIRFGATHVRVGTAIFGARESAVHDHAG
jgi:PLP dependent protein